MHYRKLKVNYEAVKKKKIFLNFSIQNVCLYLKFRLMNKNCSILFDSVNFKQIPVGKNTKYVQCILQQKKIFNFNFIKPSNYNFIVSSPTNTNNRLILKIF